MEVQKRLHAAAESLFQASPAGSGKGSIRPSKENKMKKVIGFLSLIAVVILSFTSKSPTAVGLTFPTKAIR